MPNKPSCLYKGKYRYTKLKKKIKKINKTSWMEKDHGWKNIMDEKNKNIMDGKTKNHGWKNIKDGKTSWMENHHGWKNIMEGKTTRL